MVAESHEQVHYLQMNQMNQKKSGLRGKDPKDD